MSQKKQSPKPSEEIKKKSYDINFSKTLPKNGFDIKDFTKKAEKARETFEDDDLAQSEQCF